MDILKIVNQLHTSPLEYDWIRKGSGSTIFILPPKITNEQDFKDILPEIVENKISEALERQKLLTKEQKARQKVISEHSSKEDEYFWKELDSSFFSEYYIIEKWLRYWIRISDKISGKDLGRINKDSINDFDIEKAKSYPIEDLYEGNLKKTGSRLSGICPFHEERSPSFFVYSDNGYRCFGCGEYGDSITFVMKTRKLSFVEAVKALR